MGSVKRYCRVVLPEVTVEAAGAESFQKQPFRCLPSALPCFLSELRHDRAQWCGVLRAKQSLNGKLKRSPQLNVSRRHVKQFWVKTLHYSFPALKPIFYSSSGVT
jgi:hypothetical protein